MTKRFDHINDFGDYQPTMEDLYPMQGTGQEITNYSGWKKTKTYRTGVATPIGDIKISLWIQLAEALIQRQGEQHILKALEKWLSERNYAEETPHEIYMNALNLHMQRIFDNPQWADYLPFNRQYRPTVLKNAHIVTIVSECCGLSGEITQEQLDHAYQNQVICPHCGRMSGYVIAPSAPNC